MEKLSKQQKKLLFEGIDPKRKATANTAVHRKKPLNTASFRNPYIQALYDPKDTRGVGIPDDFTSMSQKQQVTARFSGTCGGLVDSAAGFVALNPHFLAVNDSGAIYHTQATYAGLTITNQGTGVTTANSNSLYITDDFRRSSTNSPSTTNVTATRRTRLVSCMMRVESMASTVSNFGEMVGLITPLHESLVGMTFENICSFPESVRILAKQGNAIELYYTPVWPSEYLYHSYSDASEQAVDKDALQFTLDPSGSFKNIGGTYALNGSVANGVGNACNAYQPFMGVMFSGSEEIPFRVEIFANFEVIGLNVGQLATPSPYNSRALDQAKQLSAVAPRAIPTTDGFRDAGSGVIQAAPRLLQFAEDALMGTLPTPVRMGIDLLKTLL